MVSISVAVKFSKIFSFLLVIQSMQSTFFLVVWSNVWSKFEINSCRDHFSKSRGSHSVGMGKGLLMHSTRVLALHTSRFHYLLSIFIISFYPIVDMADVQQAIQAILNNGSFEIWK